MKILILGIVASGKTTLARKLSKKLKIKHYEIDSIVHDDNNLGKKRTIDEQLKIFNDINKKSWILEGTPRNNQTYIINNADIIYFIDLPLYLRKYRIIKRFIKQKLGIEKANYKANFYMLKNMFKWTKDFEYKKESIMESLNKTNKLVIIKSKKEIKRLYK